MNIRSKRLTSSSDFRKVFKTAKKFPTPFLNVYVTQNSLSHPRLGIILSKKQLPLAHQRNRVKRIARESFRKKPTIPALDIVVIGYKPLVNIQNKQLFQLFENQWQKISQYYGLAS